MNKNQRTFREKEISEKKRKKFRDFQEINREFRR